MKAKRGNPRMKQLDRVKLEVWLSTAQAAELLKLAGEMKLAKAALARRAINYMVRGGVAVCAPLRGRSYD